MHISRRYPSDTPVCLCGLVRRVDTGRCRKGHDCITDNAAAGQVFIVATFFVVNVACLTRFVSGALAWSDPLFLDETWIFTRLDVFFFVGEGDTR